MLVSVFCIRLNVRFDCLLLTFSSIGDDTLVEYPARDEHSLEKKSSIVQMVTIMPRTSSDLLEFNRLKFRPIKNGRVKKTQLIPKSAISGLVCCVERTPFYFYLFLINYYSRVQLLYHIKILYYIVYSRLHSY